MEPEQVYNIIRLGEMLPAVIVTGVVVLALGLAALMLGRVR